MAKEYNVGSRLYLPVWVTEKETNLMMGPDKSTTITDAKFSYAYWHGKTGEGKVRYGEPGLLLTAEEVASIHNRDIVNLERAVEELREENKTLRKKIEKHETTIEERTIECNRWEGMYDKASKRCDELQKTCEEDTTVAIDLANQRDNLKRKYETALKDLAQKDEACEKLKRQWDDALKDVDDLQKAVEALNKEIDGYRETIRKMSAVIGFLCGGEQDG